jgi:hypothetical protein
MDLRENNGQVEIMTDSADEGRSTWKADSMEQVKDVHSRHPLNVFPWVIVDMDTWEIDEL